MQEQVSITKEKVALERADDILEFALIEDQLNQLLIGPIICLFDGIREVEFVCMNLNIVLYLLSEGTLDLSVASLEDIDILASHEDRLRISLKNRGNHLISQQEFLLPVGPLDRFLINVNHELAIPIIDLTLVDPF